MACCHLEQQSCLVITSQRYQFFPQPRDDSMRSLYRTSGLFSHAQKQGQSSSFVWANTIFLGKRKTQWLGEDVFGSEEGTLAYVSIRLEILWILEPSPLTSDLDTWTDVIAGEKLWHLVSKLQPVVTTALPKKRGKGSQRGRNKKRGSKKKRDKRRDRGRGRKEENEKTRSGKEKEKEKVEKEKKRKLQKAEKRRRNTGFLCISK